MPSRSKAPDTATVRTGESSLRNLDYEPSVQESTMADSESGSDTEVSVLSSVMSSVKRDLKKQHHRVADYSVRSYSTSGQTAREMLQDSDSDEDDELLSSGSSSSEEEELNEEESEKAKQSKTKKSSRLKKYIELPSHKVNDVEKRQCIDQDSTFTTSTRETSGIPASLCSKSEKTTSGMNQSDDRKYTADLSEPQFLSDRSNDTRRSKKSRKSANKPRKSVEKSKQLKLSHNALAEVVQARTQEEPYTRKSRPRKKDRQIKLEHVDYVSKIDIASTNKDLSIHHPIGKSDCHSVFHPKLPQRVALSDSSHDEMSSIHALSTKAEDEELKSTNIQEGLTSIRAVPSDKSNKRQKNATRTAIGKPDDDMSSIQVLSAKHDDASAFQVVSTIEKKPGEDEMSFMQGFSINPEDQTPSLATSTCSELYIDMPASASPKRERERVKKGKSLHNDNHTDGDNAESKTSLPSKVPSLTPKSSAEEEVEDSSDQMYDVESAISVVKEQVKAIEGAQPENSAQVATKPQTRLQALIRQLQTWRASQSDGEIFLAAVVGVSVLTLILLVIVILNL